MVFLTRKEYGSRNGTETVNGVRTTVNSKVKFNEISRLPQRKKLRERLKATAEENSGGKRQSETK